MATDKDLGRDPDWDDGGLPRIDVSIPDDISELGRDIQAYHRERRREHRHELLRRFVPGYRRLGPYGVLAPVVAAALIATAVLGSVLSFLGPRPSSSRAATPLRDHGAASQDEGVGHPLPKASVVVDGGHTSLAGVQSAVVVTVPAKCHCGATIDTVTSAARRDRVAVYLSGPRDEVLSLSSREGRYPHIITGAKHALAKRYHPHGVSAVLVGRKGTVTDVLRGLRPDRLPSHGQLAKIAPTTGP